MKLYNTFEQSSQCIRISFGCFLTQSWEDYLQEMRHHGTYGDQITLQAIADMLGVEILVISTLGSEGRVWISPRSPISLCRVILGNFSEGIHYVAMRPQSLYSIFKKYILIFKCPTK